MDVKYPPSDIQLLYGDITGLLPCLRLRPCVEVDAFLLFLFPYHRLGTLFGHMVNDKHLRKEEQVRKDLIKACKVCISLGHFYTAWVWFCLSLWPPFSPFDIDHPVFHRICSAVKTPFTWWWFSLLAAWPYIPKLPHNSWPAITFSTWSFLKRANIMC